MKNLLQELFYEAQNGKVIIDREEWPISFNTIIYENGQEKERYEGENNATLVIRNEESFLELLEEYVSLELEKDRKTPKYTEKEKYHEKAIIAYLFINATPEDFHNPEPFIRRRINMLKDKSFSRLDTPLEFNGGKALLDSTVCMERKINPITMETPYRMDFTLKKEVEGEEVEYPLPSIYYGIENGTCYIYSILNRKGKAKQELSPKESFFHKKMNRQLYKVNEGVEVEPEQEEKTILDITHSFLLSLTMFLSLLESSKIDKINVVTYLPIRYQSRELIAEAREGKEQEELLERNTRIQQNATDKLIRLFQRICYHKENVEIVSYPYEEGEFLSIRIHPSDEKIKNEMLEEVSKEVKEGEEKNEFNRNI